MEETKTPDVRTAMTTPVIGAASRVAAALGLGPDSVEISTTLVKRWPVVAKSCGVEAVTVFTDRAEVTRVIHIDPEEVGQHEVFVEGLTELVVADSVRYAVFVVCAVVVPP